MHSPGGATSYYSHTNKVFLYCMLSVFWHLFLICDRVITVKCIVTFFTAAYIVRQVSLQNLFSTPILDVQANNGVKCFGGSIQGFMGEPFREAEIPSQVSLDTTACSCYNNLRHDNQVSVSGIGHQFRLLTSAPVSICILTLTANCIQISMAHNLQMYTWLRSSCTSNA